MPEKFNPEVDQFDPRQERWRWWTWDMYETVVVWKCGRVCVSIDHGRHDRVMIDVSGDEADPIYEDVFIPHAEVCRLLREHGYVPEVANA